MTTLALRAVYQIERALQRRFPELVKIAKDPDISRALTEELLSLERAINQEVSASERRGEKRFMMGRVFPR